MCGSDGCGGSCGVCFGTCGGASCICSAAPSVTFNFLSKWGSEGNFNSIRRPLGVAVAPDGTVYVADNRRMQRFDQNGTFLTSWGSFGAGGGQFRDPSGVAVHPNCTVYVTDMDNYRVQVFQPVV